MNPKTFVDPRHDPTPWCVLFCSPILFLSGNNNKQNMKTSPSGWFPLMQQSYSEKVWSTAKWRYLGKALLMKFRIHKYTYSYSYPHIILSQFACLIPLNSTSASRQERSLVSYLVAGHSRFFYDYRILVVSCTNQRGKQHCLIHHTTNRSTDTRNIQHAL